MYLSIVFYFTNIIKLFFANTNYLSRFSMIAIQSKHLKMPRGTRSSIARQRDKPRLASKALIILNIFSRCMCYYVLSVPHVGVIGVVKAGAYGHGSVHVSRHLKATGVERLAVATVDEAIHLRHHDISGPIHILGKCTNTFTHKQGKQLAPTNRHITTLLNLQACLLCFCIFQSNIKMRCSTLSM